MKKPWLLINLLFLTANYFASSLNKTPDVKQAISFTENLGQITDQNYKQRPDVLFGGSDGQMTFHIKRSGISYQLYKTDELKESENEITNEKVKRIFKQTIFRIDLKWLNNNTNFTITKDKAIPGLNNYYLSHCPNGALNIVSYTGVTLHNIYKNIDLHYYVKEGYLKHDYIIAPNTDYKQIQILVDGATIKVDADGSLLLTTPLGNIKEESPIVYQNFKQLPAKWVVKKNIISFDIENYNPNYELIIDPMTRIWGTYYGSTGEDIGQGCTTDINGNVYIAGHTLSNLGTAIATIGSHQNTHAGGYDAYLVKFNSNGVRQWATYYGGNGNEEGRACCTDPSGNVFLAGNTDSNIGSVIGTPGSHQSTFSGGVAKDAFLVKFDSNGLRVWGTYYGGLSDDRGYSCATDAIGNVYLAGQTQSNTGMGIASSGAHQTIYGGGTYNAFLVKFNSVGIRQWGTYYGGTGYDVGLDCETDASGNVYLAGYCSSTTGTIIATSSSHQLIYGGGGSDGFLVKFNTNGVRQWGTYYGGNGGDLGYSCATDAFGNIYLSGKTDTNSGTTIATIGSHQSNHAGGVNDAFLVKFNSSGVRLWGTYYGGTGGDYGQTCSTDLAGNVYLAGYTSSSTGNGIATTSALQNTYGGGVFDAFLVKLNSSGVRQWSTYYGGTGFDYAWSCYTDVSYNIYLVGYTSSSSSTVIATGGSHQSIFGGGTNSDGFLVKFRECDSIYPLINTNNPICIGTTLNFTTTTSSTATLNYYWNGPNSFTSNIQNPSINNVQLNNSGTYSVTVNDGEGCNTETAVINVIVNTTPTISITSSNSVICGPPFQGTATLNAGGANSYTWNTSASSFSIAVSPSTTTSYTVTGTDINGCMNTAAITQSVSLCTIISDFNQPYAEPKIYPNPTTGIFYIFLPNDTQLEITNTIGQSLLIEYKMKGFHQFDLSNKRDGLYFISISGNDRKYLLKLIKNSIH